jgi:hypothetical protein
MGISKMKSKDFGLASMLVSKGHEIVNYEIDDRGQVWFDFGESDDVTDFEKRFYFANETVGVLDFLAAQRRIRALIKQCKDINHDNISNRSSR